MQGSKFRSYLIECSRCRSDTSHSAKCRGHFGILSLTAVHFDTYESNLGHCSSSDRLGDMERLNRKPWRKKRNDDVAHSMHCHNLRFLQEGMKQHLASMEWPQKTNKLEVRQKLEVRHKPGVRYNPERHQPIHQRNKWNGEKTNVSDNAAVLGTLIHDVNMGRLYGRFVGTR